MGDGMGGGEEGGMEMLVGGFMPLLALLSLSWISGFLLLG